MNTTRHYVCRVCEDRFFCALVMIPSWDRKCPYCGSDDWLELYDYQPNAPEGKRIGGVAYPTGAVRLR